MAMKRWIVLLVAGFVSAGSTGCINWSPDQTLRTQQLITLSEQIRLGGNDLTALLLLNQPSNLNPVAPGGALGP
jgi:hypothetical protein